MEFFPRKRHSEILVCEIFFRPKKLGDRSPPMCEQRFVNLEMQYDNVDFKMLICEKTLKVAEKLESFETFLLTKIAYNYSNGHSNLKCGLSKLLAQ